MRKLALLLLLAVFRSSLCQDTSAFLHIRPDVMIGIQKHSTGADMVEITMLDPHYPTLLLESQCNTLCSLIGAPARGLSVTTDTIGGSDNPDMAVVRSTFATDGLIEPDGALRIEPILKAFAGAPQPYTIHGMSIDFEEMAPNAQTVEQYSLPGVLVAGARYTPEGVLKGLEYRVQLLTQDPDKISFPDHYNRPGDTTPVRPTASTPNWLLFGLVVVSGLGVGALVYFGMLRGGFKSRS